MHHIAIDLGSRESQICARNASNAIIWEKRVPTKSLPAMIAEWPKSRIVLETCAESLKVGDSAVEAGHDLRLVPATLVKVLGVGSRGVKTDIKDAQALSQASCLADLPSVHLRSERSRSRLQQLGGRAAMVSARTQLINNVRGWLRTQLLSVRSSTACFPKNVREYLAKRELEAPAWVEQLLVCIETLNQQIEAAEEAIKEEAEADTDCALLMSIPGIGPMTSLCFVAVTDGTGRFPSAHEIESYLGVTPGERSSSATVRRTGITKAGPAMLRHYLTQASLSLRRLRAHDPITVWANGIAERRGKQVATIATARKLAGIMYAMLKHGETYNPTKAATPRSTRKVAPIVVERALRKATKAR